MDLQGIGALVSGGASGLGEATTRLLVERGARVAVADVHDEKAEALASELGDPVVALHCDVTSEDEVGEAVNLAYRVQAAGYGAGIYVSQQVYERIRDAADFQEAPAIQTSDGDQPVWKLVMA